MQNDSPVGVFDSGVGGLSVLREIRAQLAHENLIYVADSGHVPYGNKSPEYISERCHVIVNFLVDRGAKAIVIACNTATAAAIKSLRQEHPDLPIVGMEPAVKPAMERSQKGRVGVLATVGTAKSAQFAALLAKFARGTKVFTQPAPGLVECVEIGDLRSEKTLHLLRSFVEPLLAEEVDVIVLGCTHYPFLRDRIAEIAGPHVALIDTGEAVARQLHRRLGMMQLLSAATAPGREEFFTSGDPISAQKTISLLWASSAPVHVTRL